MVAEVVKTVINSSKEVNLLADSTKFNEAGITSIGPVTLVQRIFTDDNLAPHLAKDFRNEGIELIPC
jgi:DeoR/GlpR family transcriptional regulator of sugar metabolism